MAQSLRGERFFSGRRDWQCGKLSEIVDEGDMPGNIAEIYELRQWLMVDLSKKTYQRHDSQPFSMGLNAQLIEATSRSV